MTIDVNSRDAIIRRKSPSGSPALTTSQRYVNGSETYTDLRARTKAPIFSAKMRSPKPLFIAAYACPHSVSSGMGFFDLNGTLASVVRTRVESRSAKPQSPEEFRRIQSYAT